MERCKPGEGHEATHQRRRARKKGTTIGDAPPWQELKASHKGKCYWCGQKLKLVWDHYVPLAKGGTHGGGNEVASCNPCNSRKGARDPYEFARSMGRLC